MMRLELALRAWGTPDFRKVLAQEIAREADHLPLLQGLSHGNYVTATPVEVMIQSVAEQGNAILVKAGIFYQGVIGGCSCADDPTIASELSEYCEVRLDIDKTTATVAVELVT